MEDDNRPLPAVIPTLLRFLPYFWPRESSRLKLRLAAAIACVLCAKAAVLTMPFAYKAVVDRMAADARDALTILILLIGAYALARFGQLLFDNLRNVAFERVGRDAIRGLAGHLFRHLHGLSLSFHLNRRTGEITKIVERGSRSIDIMLYFLLFNIAPTAIELIAVLAIFWVKFGPGLVAATLVMVALYIWFTRVVTEWRSALRIEMNEADTHAIGRSVDSLLNYETVKYFNAEEREADRYSEALARHANASVKSENSLALLNSGQALMTNATLGGAMAFSVWGWSRGDLSVGDLVLVNTLLMQLFRPLDLLGMVYRTIRQGLVDMDAMFRLMDTPRDITDAPDAADLQVGAGALRFENVHFGYDTRRTVLDGIDFEVPGGHRVAIVGPSGAGKSTIARLLFRFYDPDKGRIMIDGQDIALARQDSVRRAIGIVPQDTVLFNETIGYNIAYGREGATEDEIVEAARGAAIASFIESLPDGYDTRVGERGLKLSGGEKQRVAIARTLLKNPPILILDEATSALDSHTEQEIQTTLNALARDRTTIVIAHRLSTIVDADRIIVLDSGRIAEQGRHSELLAMNGLYASMWRRQAAARQDEPAGD